MPVVPEPSGWSFDLDGAPPGEDLIGRGADLEPGTLLAAYATGVFPMGLGRQGRPPMGWWSPDPRGVLRLPDLQVSRSMRRSARGFAVTVDSAFDEVVAGCADPGREGRWITPDLARAYARLHALGWAHSIEVRRDGALVGGLYGVALGGLFAGESMFHRATDASKVALMGLVDVLGADGDQRRLVDVQWRTDHLASLGITQVSRSRYRELLAEALRAPLPAPWR
ncbi:leucyl/phenylalanyl-tRNA--protein transferase [Dermatophilaceae bacterium Soc4.6]